MEFAAELKTKKQSECRALVPLTVTAEDKVRGYSYSLADAAFLTQLAANKKGFSQYRAKRREKPELGAKNYRTTVAHALAYQPMGKKLNYCA
jgi:hypothetical protein